MSTKVCQFIAVSIVVARTGSAVFAQHPAMPPGMTHGEHLTQLRKDTELKKRGAAAMGFDEVTTTHHFRLYETGGAIEVVANQRGDQSTVNQVRTHLKGIAAEFQRGDFGKPLATHAETPPGVQTMQQQQTALAFRYEEIPAGGRVRITASDPIVSAAIHDFLRYQIREHATGDPLEVSR